MRSATLYAIGHDASSPTSPSPVGAPNSYRITISRFDYEPPTWYEVYGLGDPHTTPQGLLGHRDTLYYTTIMVTDEATCQWEGDMSGPVGAVYCSPTTAPDSVPDPPPSDPPPQNPLPPPSLGRPQGFFAAYAHHWVQNLDGLQLWLDGAGCIPGFGEPFDFANGCISVCRGDIQAAGCSFVSVLPVAGDALGKGGKLSLYLFKHGDELVGASAGAARHLDDLAPLAPNSGKLIFDPATKSWTSPGGLVYGQGSIHGNRVKHVLDHLVPNPGKATHSIFNSDRTQLIGLLDDAWKSKVGPGILQPNGNRVWTVDMGRVIGTNGETFIQIVVKDGTTNVITAFPKPVP